MNGPGTRRRADPARRTAYDVLRAVAQRDAYANLLLPALLAERGLAGRDAALATELTYGTLRGQGSYDAVLDVCSDRPVGRMDPAVREVLRLGAHQLLATRIPPHAAVAASVDLAKDVAGARPAGFVNAVLRQVATRGLADWLAIVAPEPADDPVGHLAVMHSHPRWVVAALSDALGEQADGPLTETEELLAADNSRPGVTLLAKPGRMVPGELLAAGATPARWSPYGAYLREGNPADVPAVADGRAAVQDEASQLAAVALARVPVAGQDRLWLDMCSGPGGKASLLFGIAVGRGARLLAADLQPHRAALTRAAMGGRTTGRTTGGAAARGVAGAGGAGRIVVADGTSPPWRHGTFDRVLADVPCSGLGALRRRPEARWRRRPRDVAGFGPLQRRLLATALASVRPGGVVAYVTCSPHLDETGRVVGDVIAAMAATVGVSVLDAPAVLAGVPAVGAPGLAAEGLRCPPDEAGLTGATDLGPGALRPAGPGRGAPGLVAHGPAASGHSAPRAGVPGGYAQFWPHRHGTDAIFLALLRRDT
ncbi:MAG TPA: transcription antitermination factor NusB [Streptosporangiaceae bacterium]|nr:transcription antitermination factor NusB [Streptosporangiaceae bacterium]